MRRYEIAYIEEDKFFILNIYGFENYVTFLEENGSYIDIISIDEFEA